MHGILLIPLILGFGFPEKTLDSAVAEKRIISGSLPTAQPTHAPTEVSMPFSEPDVSLTEQQPKIADDMNAGNPKTLPSAETLTVPTNKIQQAQADNHPSKATPRPESEINQSENGKPNKKAGVPPANKTGQNSKANADTQQTVPKKAQPQKNQPAVEKNNQSKNAPVAAAAPAPSKKPSSSSNQAAPPVADASNIEPVDDNGQNDIKKFNQKEIAIMQMRMGIEANSSTAADSSATENEGTKAEKIMLTDDNFATTMGEIFASPDAYAGIELEMTGFVLHSKELPEDEAFIVRYVITCCIADATPTYVIAKSDKLKSLKNDTWVTATGTLAKNSNPKWGYAPFMSLSSIGKMKEPKDPYAYY